MTDEGRRKLSELMRARWEDPATREPLIEGIRRTRKPHVVTEDTKAKISASRTQAWRNEESRARQCKAQSEGQRAAWADPEKAQARIEKCRATRLAKLIANGGSPPPRPGEPPPQRPDTVTILPRTATGAIDVDSR